MAPEADVEYYWMKRRFSSISGPSDPAPIGVSGTSHEGPGKRLRRDSREGHDLMRENSDSTAAQCPDDSMHPENAIADNTNYRYLQAAERPMLLPGDLPSRLHASSTEEESLKNDANAAGIDMLRHLEVDDDQGFTEPYIRHAVSEMMKDFETTCDSSPEALAYIHIFGGARFGEPFRIDSFTTRDENIATSTDTIEDYNFDDACINVLLSKSEAKGNVVNLTVMKVAAELNRILQDQSRYRALLKCDGFDPANILNMLQILNEYSALNTSIRKRFVFASLRFSKKFALYPQCFKLKNVQREEAPVTAGHFGEVWKGRLHGKNICLKVVKVYQKSQIDHLLKAFSREAILWGHLSHRNLLPFYGIYHLEDRYERICLISPWMENGNINEYLKQNPEVNRLLLISDIIQGILYLHDNDMIHGDLKGANILVAASGRACVADFGLCTIIDAEILKWTSIESSAHAGGTVRWQAPELLNESSQSTKASDIYAFSCVCYEIFTGQVPFSEVFREATVIYKVMQGERPTRPYLSARGPGSYFSMGLTEPMWDLMETCWKKNPEERPQAQEVNHRLPMSGLLDRRTHRDWNDLSPSQFRSIMYDSSSYPSIGIMEETMKWLQHLN